MFWHYLPCLGLALLTAVAMLTHQPTDIIIGLAVGSGVLGFLPMFGKALTYVY